MPSSRTTRPIVERRATAASSGVEGAGSPADPPGPAPRGQPQAARAGDPRAPAAGDHRPRRRRGRRRDDAPERVPAEDADAPRGRGAGLPIYVLKSNTILQMQASLTSIFALEVDPREAALRETEEAIGLVHRAIRGRRAVARRTPTSAGSSTRWPSARTSSRGRAAASRTGACASTRTRPGRLAIAETGAVEPGQPSVGILHRWSTSCPSCRCTRSSSTAPEHRAARRVLVGRPRLRPVVRAVRPVRRAQAARPMTQPAAWRSSSSACPSRRSSRTGPTSTTRPVDRAAEVERLVGLGATLIREVDEGAGLRWTVMADPAGNEFCVAQA